MAKTKLFDPITHCGKWPNKNTTLSLQKPWYTVSIVTEKSMWSLTEVSWNLLFLCVLKGSQGLPDTSKSISRPKFPSALHGCMWPRCIHKVHVSVPSACASADVNMWWTVVLFSRIKFRYSAQISEALANSKSMPRACNDRMAVNESSRGLLTIKGQVALVYACRHVPSTSFCDIMAIVLILLYFSMSKPIYNLHSNIYFPHTHFHHVTP